MGNLKKIKYILRNFYKERILGRIRKHWGGGALPFPYGRLRARARITGREKKEG